jgi:hypothetical protein
MFKVKNKINTDDCLIEMTAWTGLTTFFLTYKIFINTYKNKIRKFLTGLHGFVYATTVYIYFDH